jgi:hypothetical protein
MKSCYERRSLARLGPADARLLAAQRAFIN